MFELSCAPTDLASISVSGPCATGDASNSQEPLGPTGTAVGVASPSPGVCHVVLLFATGFRYAADVTFVSQSDTPPPGCPVSHYTVPTQRTFTVNNPSNTCVDAGLDAGVDGPADAATCPASASQSVSCAFSGSCTGCRDNVRFACTCTDGGLPGDDAGGSQWQCTDTGMPCM